MRPGTKWPTDRYRSAARGLVTAAWEDWNTSGKKKKIHLLNSSVSSDNCSNLLTVGKGFVYSHFTAVCSSALTTTLEISTNDALPKSHNDRKGKHCGGPMTFSSYRHCLKVGVWHRCFAWLTPISLGLQEMALSHSMTINLTQADRRCHLKHA